MSLREAILEDLRRFAVSDLVLLRNGLDNRLERGLEIEADRILAIIEQHQGKVLWEIEDRFSQDGRKVRVLVVEDEGREQDNGE